MGLQDIARDVIDEEQQKQAHDKEIEQAKADAAAETEAAQQQHEKNKEQGLL